MHITKPQIVHSIKLTKPTDLSCGKNTIWYCRISSIRTWRL